jgi:hypothetical protein
MAFNANKVWQHVRNHRKVFGLLVYLLFCFLAFYLDNNPWGTYYVPKEKVWHEVQSIAAEKNLDANFVYAIAWAESSLNAHAHTHVARGIMQMTHDAWDRVARATWRDAYDWKLNLEAGCSYLVALRSELKAELKEDPTNAQLAGAYRYGFSKLKSCKFDVQKLPETNNQIYQKLFSGDSVPVAPPNG